MNRFLGVPLVAMVLWVIAANTAEASFCGAARYRCSKRAVCCPAEYAECKQQCYTVMKTVKEVVYEKRQYTCYKTVYERVCEQKTVNVVKYVPETRYKECVYTVCKPVWETRTKEICYTVCKLSLIHISEPTRPY